MNILAFVDLHGNLKKFELIQKKAKEADIILCAGDLTVFENNLDIFLKNLDHLGKFTLIIHGNHEEDGSLRLACKDLKNVKFLHRKIFKFNDMYFFGWGGGGFSDKEPELDRKRDEYEKVLKGKQWIFMTHQPVYNTSTDMVHGDHVGSVSFRKFIEKNQPKVCVCGHIHETAGRQHRIGKTLVINPGPEGVMLKF